MELPGSLDRTVEYLDGRLRETSYTPAHDRYSYAETDIYERRSRNFAAYPIPNELSSSAHTTTRLAATRGQMTTEAVSPRFWNWQRNSQRRLRKVRFDGFCLPTRSHPFRVPAWATTRTLKPVANGVRFEPCFRSKRSATTQPNPVRRSTRLVPPRLSGHRRLSRLCF